MTIERLERFTRTERIFHWTNAGAVLFQLATGAIVWRELDNWRIHHVNVVSQAHFWIGLLVIGLGAALFLLLHRRRIPACEWRFNRGQRLNLRGFQVLLGWMLASGVVLRFGRAWHLGKPTLSVIREAHLVSAGLVLVGIGAHMAMVFAVPRNRGILQGMLGGYVERTVAERSSPSWARRALEEER